MNKGKEIKKEDCWSSNISNGGWTNTRELVMPKKLFFYRHTIGRVIDCIHDKQVWEKRVKDIF